VGKKEAKFEGVKLQDNYNSHHCSEFTACTHVKYQYLNFRRLAVERGCAVHTMT